jgi:hypothetical protein
MTQEGETEGYTASDHIKALFSHSGAKLFDYCLANNLEMPDEIISRYTAQGAEVTRVDEKEINKMGIELVCAPVADIKGGLARHDPVPFQRLFSICQGQVPNKNLLIAPDTLRVPKTTGKSRKNVVSIVIKPSYAKFPISKRCLPARRLRVPAVCQHFPHHRNKIMTGSPDSPEDSQTIQRAFGVSFDRSPT